MKTAISIPDTVFQRAERLAKQRKISRSELYTAALVYILEREPKDELTRAYDSAFTDHERDPLIEQTARDTLLDVEWSEG